MIASALDRALDWTVFPGYTSLGYGLRAAAWDGGILRRRARGAHGARHRRQLGDRRGGGRAARAARRQRPHAGARPRARRAAPERVASKLEDSGIEAGSRSSSTCDLSDLDSVRDFAAAFEPRAPPLRPRPQRRRHDAGPRAQRPGSRAHLRDPRARAVPAHPCCSRRCARGPLAGRLVTSGGMYTARLDADDLELERRDFDGARFYAHAKRIQVILAELAARERGAASPTPRCTPAGPTRPACASLPRFRRLVGPLLRSPEQGADTIVWLLATAAAEQRPAPSGTTAGPAPRTACRAPGSGGGAPPALERARADTGGATTRKEADHGSLPGTIRIAPAGGGLRLHGRLLQGPRVGRRRRGGVPAAPAACGEGPASR